MYEEKSNAKGAPNMSVLLEAPVRDRSNYKVDAR
jgi:hypothetical protein